MTYQGDTEITFDNIVTFANETIYHSTDTSNAPGMFRYNATSDKFEGFHNADILGNSSATDVNKWRPLTQNIATTSEYGVFKVGSNLIMNESTGYLSSITASGTRLKQLIITVSPQSEGGDYTSINDAISNVIGTASGGYMDGSLTQASNLNAAPNSSNSFIILIAPGIYTESSQIVLPNYVSLRGEGKNQVIIQKTASSNQNLDDSAIVKIGSNSSITDITFRMNPNNMSNICGIYANSNNDVFINNILVEDTGSNGSTSNCIGTYIVGGSNILVNNYETKFTLDSTDIYGLYSANNRLELNNAKINIEANGNTTNYGVYLGNCNLIEDRSIINNNFINVSGGTTNYGIYLSNSSARIQYTNIDTIDETSGRSSYGVALRGESSTAYSVSSAIISFTHSDSAKDTIVSNNTATVNFVTLGFTRGQGIKVSGASTAINNGYFTIFNVTTDTITLIEQDVLSTEAASATITIQELFLTNLSYSHIEGTTNSIKSLDSNGSYQVETNYCILEGGNPDLGSDNILFTHNHVITVALVGGDYNTLASAIDSILHNTSKNRYLIKVMPGEYVESSAITLKEYVTILGSGRENTIITFNNKNATLASGGGLTLTSNCELSDLTIKNVTTGSNSESSFVLYAVGTSSTVKLENVNLFNLNIISSGVASTQYGIYMEYCNYISNNINITITGATSSSSSNSGWFHRESGHINKGTDIQLFGGAAASVNTGVILRKSDVNFFDSNISVQGSTTANYGIQTVEETTDYNIAQFFSGKIAAPASSGTNYSILNGATNTNYMSILNGIHLVGDTEDNSSDGRKLVCHNCYKIDSNTYKPINIRGQTDENTNNSLTIGYTAGKIDVIGDYNTFIGVNSGQNTTTGERNTFIGYSTGKNNTTGDENTFIGHNAGTNCTTGINNIAIGSNAGLNMTTAKDNIHIGRGSGLTNISGLDNISIGSNAAQTLSTGDKNIMIGYKSGLNASTASHNTLVGTLSGYNITTGGNNTIMGHSAGYSLTTGSNVVLIGDKAGYTNTASDSVMLGSYSGYLNTSGTNNFFMGYKAGYTNTTGSRNIYLGNRAGYSSTTASNNILIGGEAGYSITTGNKNILIGSKTDDTTASNDAAGWSLTSGNLNVAIGSQSGKLITTGRNNILLGGDSGGKITTGNDNILIGKSTGVGGTGVTTASQNIFIGSCAGVNASKSNNLFIGNNAGANSTGNDLLFMGNLSGQNVTGDRNMFIGYQSGALSTTTGTDNLCMGIHTGFSLTSGSRNLILGTGDTLKSAGRQLTTGSDNIMMGYRTGGNLQIGNENVFIGSNAGGATTSSKNIAIGTQSGRDGQGQIEGTDRVGGNINIGYQAGNKQTTATYNLNIGYKAGFNNTEGQYNINVGYMAGNATVTNDNNIHMGYQAGCNSIADNNIFMGYQSGYKTHNINADYNLFIGYQSGYSTTSGENNMYFGSNAGLYNTTGDDNVFIGYNTGKGTSNYAVSKTILIGPSAGLNNLGSKNIYIGSATNDSKGIGYQSTSTSTKNVFIGVDTGLELTNGIQNIGIGVNCLQNILTGSNNTSFGVSAGLNLTTASNNIIMGNESGKTLVTGNRNVIIGDKSGSTACGAVTINDCLLIGESAGQNIATSNIIAIGTQAGKNNTTGINNFYIGTDAGRQNTTSSNNLMIGYKAGESITTGDGRNIFIGNEAGKNIQTGTNNLVIGHNSIPGGSTTSNTIIIGHESGRNISSGINNIAIGINALDTNSTGDNNICMGYQAGENLNTSNCILIGLSSGQSITSGNNNIGFGTESLNKTTSGSNNSAIGYQALYENTTGSGNFASGYNALRENRTRNNNFAIGFEAGNYFGAVDTSSNEQGNNTFLGYNAGKYNNGSNNVFIGKNSGRSASSGAGNDYELNTGSNNTAIGVSALSALTTGSNNTVIGGNAGSITTGNNNFIGGSGAAANLNTGNDNVMIGHQTGQNETGGSNNVYMSWGSGYKDSGAADYNNNIAIGLYAMRGDTYLDTSYSLNNNVVIGQMAAQYAKSGTGDNITRQPIINNTIIGRQAARNCSGSNGTIIGSYAGYNCHGNNNVYIGTGTGYNNPFGKNNIFLSTTTNSTLSYSNLSVSVSDIFAVYQDNGLDSGTMPILYGNLSNSAIAINNRTVATGSETATKLYVNGKVWAESYSSFTGLHNVNLSNENEEVEEGHIMISTGNVVKNDTLDTIVEVTKSTKEKEKTVYGIYAGFEMIGESPNDKKQNKVASLGEGTMLVCNINGDIMNGDYICSSIIPGLGMKQNDDIVYNYTVAKSTQDVDWSNISNVVEWEGNEYKKYMISCTYHCG